FAPFRHTGAAACDREDGFAEARADGIDGDNVASLILAVRRDRLQDKELAAFQTGVLAGSDHRTHNTGEDHAVVTSRFPRRRSICRWGGWLPGRGVGVG